MVSDKALCFVLDQKAEDEEGEPSRKRRKKDPKKTSKDKKAHHTVRFQFGTLNLQGL